MTKKKSAFKTKLFVLDTNILLHDPNSVLKFENHDVFIPFTTLEELDNKKAGQTDINRNARQATRLLEQIVSQTDCEMKTGFPLITINGGHAKGRLFVQSESLPFLSHEHLHKNDNMYLAVLDHLTKTQVGREIIMVTKDLNLRIKARALGFTSEDFKHDHAVDDADLVYRGWRDVGCTEYDKWGANLQSWKDGRDVFYRVPHTDERINEFLVFLSGDLFRVVSINDADKTCELKSVVDTRVPKNAVLGVCARNEEQRAALELLMDPEVDLVALLGPAGTGKTLLALAASMAQVQADVYDSIVFTRANTPLGEDIGFLPGTEEEKMAPWLGAMFDNIDVLAELASSEVEGHKIRTMGEEKIDIRAMTFMRGRTFHRKIVILDEAQNLTPKQMKALVTRAGEGSKLIVLGNLAQIDSPYLSETSSGLSYVVERFKGWAHGGALVLDKGERSRLANAGNDLL